MQIEQNNTNSNQLPYTPLQFAYSGTIGAKRKNAESGFIYSHHYNDILTPRILQHHNPVFYLLFHTPTVYNWIRTITTNQAKLLDSYIRFSNPTKNGINKFSLELLQKSMEDYVKKWEVVKLSFCHKVYLKRQISGQLCSHLGKTEVYTHHIEYIPKNKEFNYPQIHCKQCQKSFKFQCQNRQYSQYLLLHNPSQSSIKLNKLNYDIYLMIGEEVIYIKCANKVWYQVNPINQTVKTIGFTQIQMKKIKLGAYSQPISQQSMLKLALPFIQLDTIPHVQMLQTNNQKDIIKNELQFKPFKKVQSKKGSLTQLKAKSTQIILKNASKNYINEVSRLYIEPKKKDQYEVDYDKGKLKKIKEKKQYIRPDFNQIHQQLKKNGVFEKGAQKLGKKIKKKLKHKQESSSGEE